MAPRSASRAGTRRRPAGPRCAATLAALALVLAGCGGEEGGSEREAVDRPADVPDATGDGDGAPVDGPEPPPPRGPVGDDELVDLAGGAPAARGAGLAEPPGTVARELLDGFGEVAVAITAPDGTVTGWCVLVAATFDQRARGLMEVTDLGGYAGMIFVYDADSEGGYYMRNTPMPLTIAWFDAEGAVVSTADMEPCDDVDGCPTYHPTAPYRFALEVPQGELPAMGVTEGSRLAVGGACAPG